MKRVAVFAVALACLLLCPDVPSARTFTVYGAGNKSCGGWVGHNQSQRDAILVSWTLGFVSGAGLGSSTDQKTTDVKGIAAWMDNYCGMHPLDPIATAASILIHELETSR
jgi:hypothetical protein